MDSNHRPVPYKSTALTAELQARNRSTLPENTLDYQPPALLRYTYIVMIKHLQKLACILSLSILLIPAVAQADVVKSFHSDVTIGRDNTASVKETVVYDPQDGTHHGIYRFVPAQFADSSGHKYYTRIKYISVTDANGNAYPIAEEYSNLDQLYLKIGDKDTLLSAGPHTYIIRYEITPLVVQGDGFDRFIFNVTGEQWDTTISNADVIVHVDSTSVTDAACYTGANGSTAHDCLATVLAGNTISASTSHPLGLSEGLTVDVKLAPGGFSTYLVPDKRPPLSGTEKTELALTIITVGLVLFSALRTIFHYLLDVRERHAQTIIPEYEPPDSLTPAEMSILESPRSDVADVTATVIDLAVRGYLKIEQTQAKAWYRSAHYKLTKLKDTPALRDYERELFDAFFMAGDTLELHKIKSNISQSAALQKATKGLRTKIGKDLKQKGYYLSSPTTAWWVFRLVAMLASAAAAVGAFVSIANGDDAVGWVAIAVIAAVVSFGLTYLRTDRTLEGNKEWAKVRGFKWFLEVTEKDRLDFTDAPDKTPALFSKLLPYAIALGVEKQWAKQFEGIDITHSVGIWYIGYPGQFNSTAFASDFSSSFGGAVSSSFAGSSGGGSAGGGGGGGGGGGW
jgi:uncharacterized protein (TIGR04222 family)